MLLLVEDFVDTAYLPSCWVIDLGILVVLKVVEQGSPLHIFFPKLQWHLWHSSSSIISPSKMVPIPGISIQIGRGHASNGTHSGLDPFKRTYPFGHSFGRQPSTQTSCAQRVE